VQRRIQLVQLGGDLAGGFGPGEGLGVVVALGGVALDGGLQFDNRAENAALEPLPGQGGEEALDCIQPRSVPSSTFRAANSVVVPLRL
jgi:hypothetical protein